MSRLSLTNAIQALTILRHYAPDAELVSCASGHPFTYLAVECPEDAKFTAADVSRLNELRWYWAATYDTGYLEQWTFGFTGPHDPNCKAYMREPPIQP